MLIPAVLVATAVSSCGGDSGPSKAEFIEDADALCAEASRKAEPVIAEHLPDPQNPTPEQILGAVQAAVPIQRETIAKIADLERPEDDEDEIQNYIDKANEGLDEAEQIEDPQAAVSYIQLADTPQDPFYEANQAAEEYGLDDCTK